MASENIQQPPPDHPLYFIRRRDGKYLRGARWCPWCRNWRDAAAISKYVYGFVDEKLKAEEAEFLTLEQVVELERGESGGVRDSVRGFVIAVASLVGF